MVQTTNRFFDEVARLMNDAAGAAQGVRREFETLFRSQAERILRDLAVVQREEFEAVKDMARLAREENETLKSRVAELEAKIGATPSPENPRWSRCAVRRSGFAAPIERGSRVALPKPLQRCQYRGMHFHPGETNSVGLNIPTPFHKLI